MANNLLVTGANGFIGRETCRALAALHLPFRRAVRRLPPASLPVEWRDSPASSPSPDICPVGDIGAATDWSEALDGIEIVIHLAAHVHVSSRSAAAQAEFHRVNTLGTEQLAKSAVRAGVRRFLYLSSVGVHGRSTHGRPCTETDEPQPHDAYTLSKWRAEQKLQALTRDSALESVIIRPPLVYGPGEPGNFMRLIRLLDSGLPIPLGATPGRRSLIHVGNLAHAIVTCARHPGAPGQTFLVSDGEDVSTRELITRIANALGRRALLFPFPLAGLRLFGKLTGTSGRLDSLLGSLLIDSSKIRRQLGWSPPFRMSDGLRETVGWYLANKTAISRSPGLGPRIVA